jgi:ABC-2 type transport system permease protein
VQTLLRLRSEETGGAAEVVLSTAVARTRWVATHLACAVGGAAVVLLAAGLCAGVADSASGGVTYVSTLVVAGLAQLHSFLPPRPDTVTADLAHDGAPSYPGGAPVGLVSSA